MRVGSLFSGIGGFDLGLERSGMEIIWQVEIDEFCQKVLAKHWPDVKRYGDIKNVTNLEPVDLICGGFPCQPFSCAGKRKGAEDDRALWPEMLRLIQELNPRWIVGENVAGIINMELDNCISDLERAGYAVQVFIIPACAINAPHRRDRVWICAHSVNGEHGTERGQIRETDGLPGINRTALRSGRIERTDSHAPDTNGFNGNNAGHGSGEISQQQASGIQKLSNHVSDSPNERLQGGLKAVRKEGQESHDELLHGCRGEWSEPWLEVATRLCRVDDGVSTELDEFGRISSESKTKNKTSAGRVHRLKALGNAVVPQIVEIIGRAILEIERT